jgi:glycosyltransferase involved in cell wall biosynthesis
MTRLNDGPAEASFDPLVIFTICASNYLAHAIVLGESVRVHHPGLTLTIFLLDDLPVGVTLPKGLAIIAAHLAMPAAEWTHRACFYDILEFATSLKPACFRHLFDKGVRRAIYLDPDIQLFHRVDGFWPDGAVDPALVLTPHILAPLPDDGCVPDDLGIMRAGLFNLGFAAMRDTEATRALLDWWDRKLHTLCLRDVAAGVFTDQKWMDYAPLLVPHTAVLRHLGYNVAYWNLHERTPRKANGTWQVRQRTGEWHRLIFFHFSGFTPDRADISRHETRFGANPPGDTSHLFAVYAEALARAGLKSFAAIGEPKLRFADGALWDPACRMLYRRTVAEGLNLGHPLHEPRFAAWAAGHATGDALTRYARAALDMRGDVALGGDPAAILSWLRDVGVGEIGLDPALVERLAAPEQARRLAVNYVGYLRAHLGIGEAARNSVGALEAAGIATHCHDISARSDAPTGHYALSSADPGREPAAITILGCNADQLPTVLQSLPPAIRDTYRIGCWYWETPSFPEHWADRFDLVDEVWAATRFIADAIREKATVPVVVMPPMVAPPAPQRDRAWMTTLVPEVAQDEFVFLVQFDVASIPFRKNPEGAIAAFAQAFAPAEPVRLVVKALNAQAAPAMMAALREAAPGRRISFLTDVLESADRFRLLASCDSFVSLHRAEGFGLSIAEAMAYGLPVVTTNWSGNLDFTTPGSAALVPCDLLPSAIAHPPYPVGTVWAEPRLDEAARLMRRIWTDTAWRESLARAGQAGVGRLLSAEAVGSAMKARLERIARSARVTARRATPPMRKVPPMGLRLLQDAMRYPGYYLVRLPRVPGLLLRHGPAGAWRRAGSVVEGAHEIKGRYRISGIRQAWMAWRNRMRQRRQAEGTRP